MRIFQATVLIQTDLFFQIMCFSAEASFTSATVLVVIGVVAIRKCKAPQQLFFASIPLLLAVQQFSEGYLWFIFSGRGNAFWEEMSSVTFLFFAQVLWPSWIPFSILLLEKRRQLKKTLIGIFGIGVLVSCYFAYRLIYDPVKAEVIGHHISYSIGTSSLLLRFAGVLYFLCTIVPAFISSINKMYLLGVSIAISYFFSALFFEHYVISVWCFFAAITSIFVFFIQFHLGKKHTENMRSAIEF